jgi:hypothetical protein
MIFFHWEIELTDASCSHAEELQCKTLHTFSVLLYTQSKETACITFYLKSVNLHTSGMIILHEINISITQQPC